MAWTASGSECRTSTAANQPPETSCFRLWQVQLGVNGQRLVEGTKFVLATADDARGSDDLLPQVKDAIGDIPGNVRPGQSIGNSCGGF